MTVTRRKITDYIPDAHNANVGTERGQRAIHDSLRELGAGRSIVAAADNTIIAGNKTLENAADVGIEDVIEVETDGRALVVVKRTDWPTSTDKRAIRYGIADNRSSELSLNWSADVLAELQAQDAAPGIKHTSDLQAS